MNSPKILVIAGNYAQYREWCYDNKVSYQDAVYVDRPEKILGRYDSPYVEAGTPYLNKDYYEIMKYVDVYSLQWWEPDCRVHNEHTVTVMGITVCAACLQ